MLCSEGSQPSTGTVLSEAGLQQPLGDWVYKHEALRFIGWSIFIQPDRAMHRKRDHKMSLVLRPEVMWPKRLLLALLARQCSAEPRMEDLGKKELGLVNRD